MGFIPAKDKSVSAEPGEHGGTDDGGPHGPGGPHGEYDQIIQFKGDPTQFARYQLLQNGREVGWVYVAGNSTNDSTEMWQLYRSTVTGYGEARAGESAPGRAGYTWPSPDNASGEQQDVTTRMRYFDATPAVRAPANLQEGTHYQQVKARCT